MVYGRTVLFCFLLGEIILESELRDVSGFLLCLVFFFLFLCLVFCCKKAMLGYLPHCADNGREPTSVAFMYKEETMHRFDGSCSSSTGNYCLFW